jgi:hypothetical protein
MVVNHFCTGQFTAVCMASGMVHVSSQHNQPLNVLRIAGFRCMLLHCWLAWCLSKGRAHTGMLECAAVIIQQCLPTLEQQLQQNPG